MMNDWYQRMVDTIHLNGKAERTQQAYARSVRMLSEFYGKTPDLIWLDRPSEAGMVSDLPQ